uniref:DUF460 domain-containing protein n=1 Tax=Fervidicoccus fontis TaxID=683846 RepID=A0A7J3ZJ54_9CREN
MIEDLKNKECVMGVDINPGGHSTSRATYSLVILCHGKLVYKNDQASLERTLRLAWEYRPKAIAVDNPLELAENARVLAKLVEILPEETELVWVNETDEGVLKLKALASKEDVKLQGRRSPLKTAYLLALLAGSGVGTPIVKREEVTRIIVRRTRLTRKGGMSANRFKRRTRASLLRVTRTIKQALDSKGLDYELTYKSSSGGLEGAIFVVYAPREVVREAVKPHSYGDARVVIKTTYRVELSRQSEKEPRPVIVGIDPGLNTGIAVLGLDGTPISIVTRRSVDRMEIINYLREIGKPIIIATDSTPVPGLAKKLSAVFNARIFTPEKQVPVEEKKHIASLYAERFNIRVLDSHSRDALAAAYLAFRDLSSKLAELEERLERMGVSVPIDRVKKLVIEGMSVSDAIEAAIREELNGLPKLSQGLTQTQTSATGINVERLRKKIERLKWENAQLLIKLEEYRERVAALERQLQEVCSKLKSNIEESVRRELAALKDNIRKLELLVREKESVISKLREENSTLKTLLRGASVNRLVVIPRVPALTKSNLNKLTARLEGVLVYVDNIDAYQMEAIELLKQEKCYGVLYPHAPGDTGAISVLKEHAIPAVSLSEAKVPYRVFEEFVVIEPSIKKVVDERRREMLRESNLREKMKLYKLFEEYKMRWKTI